MVLRYDFLPSWFSPYLLQLPVYAPLWGCHDPWLSVAAGQIPIAAHLVARACSDNPIWSHRVRHRMDATAQWESRIRRQGIRFCFMSGWELSRGDSFKGAGHMDERLEDLMRNVVRKSRGTHWWQIDTERPPISHPPARSTFPAWTPLARTTHQLSSPPPYLHTPPQ